MGRRSLLPALAMFVVASVAFARATDRLDALAAGVAARRSAPGWTRVQSRALASAAKLLAKNTTSASADMAVASRVAKVLDAAFPEDAEFGDDLDAAMAAFRDDVDAERGNLADLLDFLPLGKKTTAGRNVAAKIDGLLGQYVAVDHDLYYDPTLLRSSKLTWLAKADVLVAKAAKAAVGAENWVIAYDLDGGVSFVSQIASGSDVSGALAISATVYDGRFGVDPSRRIDLAAHSVVATGDYALDDGTQYSASPPVGDVGTTWRSSGGTMTVTTLVGGVVEGTFSFVGIEPQSGTSKRVASGRFHVRLKK